MASEIRDLSLEQFVFEVNDKRDKIRELKNKRKSIKEFRDRDFSEYCEYVVAFKLQELGWKVYQPLSDRYVDIVASRELNGKPIIRTIQVKGSRIELEGKKLTYGLTHKPKDLMHDSAHFFIWLFFDNNEKGHFIVLSVSDFINVMGSGLQTMSWRKGNDRIHFSSQLEKTKLKDYLNNWNNLLKGGKPNTAKICIDSQEIEEFWRSSKSVEKWKETNLKIIKQIPSDMMQRIKRKTEVEE